MNLDDLIVGKALAVSVMASKETKVIVRYGPRTLKHFSEGKILLAIYFFWCSFSGLFLDQPVVETNEGFASWSYKSNSWRQ
jgi:hypothetical protein